jgi:hypothetical protein
MKAEQRLSQVLSQRRDCFPLLFQCVESHSSVEAKSLEENNTPMAMELVPEHSSNPGSGCFRDMEPS